MLVMDRSCPEESETNSVTEFDHQVPTAAWTQVQGS